ncbi:MAG: DUF3014 domain-containing protein [Elusimicrobia bacterium]|nr:DUF3014 domain-containing protein [Elusimicrobiota bacterium]
MKNPGLLIVAVLLAAGAAIGLYGARSLLKPAPAAPGISSLPPEAPAALPPDLPPLEKSDEFVRRRAAALSSDAAFQEWLKKESLIPRLTAAMNMIANGKFPRDLFAAFAPRGKFSVVRKDGKILVDPASYARYDGVAAMVGRVDAVAAARVFTDLMPLFDAAQRGLGEKTASAHEAFFAAARELVDVPPLDGEAVLTAGKKGIGWVYADESLESLSPAQKQLLRMGPKNQAAVQAKLRAVVLALGVPGSKP